MSAMASQITSLTIVYSTVYSRRRSNKTSKLRATGLCEGNSPGTGEFPAQKASGAVNVSIWWCHHEFSRISLKVMAYASHRKLWNFSTYPSHPIPHIHSEPSQEFDWIVLCCQGCVKMAFQPTKHSKILWQPVPRTLRPASFFQIYYIDVIMTTTASQNTILTVVNSTVYSDADQRKHQSSASLAFVWGIHRDRWIPRTKGQLRGKCFHLMTSSCLSAYDCLHPTECVILVRAKIMGSIVSTGQITTHPSICTCIWMMSSLVILSISSLTLSYQNIFLILIISNLHLKLPMKTTLSKCFTHRMAVSKACFFQTKLQISHILSASSSDIFVVKRQQADGWLPGSHGRNVCGNCLISEAARAVFTL